MKIKNYILICLILFVSVFTEAQNVISVDTSAVDSVYLLKKSELKRFNKNIDKWMNEGYWEANIDEVIQSDSIYKALVHKGEKYDSLHINLQNIDDLFKDKYQYKSTLNTSFEGYGNLVERLKTFYQEQGFIFVTITTENFHFKNKTLHITLNLKRNRRMYWGKIKIKSEVTLPEKYIYSLINRNEGDLFRKSDLINLQTSIKGLKYLKLATGIKIAFFQQTAEILLYFEKTPANNFDVLLGVQSTTDALNQQQFVITGTAHIDIYNAFSQGENIFAEYKQIKKNHQKIQINTTWPYLKLLPSFGVGGQFLLHKRDTLSLELKYGASVIYNINSYFKLRTGYSGVESRILNIDTSKILLTKSLPNNNLDLKHNNLIVAIEYNKVDNKLNPRIGLIGNIDALFGKRTIIPNGNITSLKDPQDPSFDFGKLYEDISLETFIYTLKSDISYYFPLKKRSSIKSTLYLGLINSKGKIYENESFRLGGHKIIRGYNEEELVTPNYAAFSLEYRFLLGQLSYLFGFVDGAYVQNRVTKKAPFFLGVGVGMNLNIKGGVLGLSYAIGKRDTLPFDFKNSKIHFKYINYF